MLRTLGLKNVNRYADLACTFTHVIHVDRVPYELPINFQDRDVNGSRVLVKQKVRKFHLGNKLVAENQC